MTIADWLLFEPAKIPLILMNVVLAYLALVVLTRLGGIRSFSKMSGFDFAITVSIGSIFASIIMSKDPSIGQGLTALAFVFVIQLFVATLRQRSKFIEKLTSNSPRMIMIGSDIQEDQMRKAQISKSDLYAKLREANVFHFDQIICVIAETTGDVSVLHTENAKDLSPDIFKTVIGSERLLTP